MVGLKTLWILILATFMLAACVPQTKQSECKGNEAFNAALRSCVPVMGAPTSFVNISNFSPSSAITKSKNDFLNVPLSISVSNPYGQAYDIRWERIYNGVPDLLPTCDNVMSCNVIRGYDLGTVYGQMGIHIVSVKIMSGTTIIDSHSFEILINNDPQPTINNSSVQPSPTVYNVTLTPLDGPQVFSFTINNNNTLAPASNWRTKWTVTKNNVLLTPALNPVDDFFINMGPSETNTAELGTPLTPAFNPATLGLGAYTIRAQVMKDLGVVVDERLWMVNVQHPDLGVVSAAFSPLQSTTTTAFHGTAYNSYGFFDALDTLRIRSDYCVTVSNPEGAYADGGPLDSTIPYKNVLVRFYKDGSGSPIYEGKTSAADDTICFSDAPPAQQAQLFFADGASTAVYTKMLRARVFDEQTGLELCVNGGICSLVTYPIDWSITVNPLNTPVASVILNRVSAADNVTYVTPPTTTTTSSTATVTQDLTFKLRYKITDHYLEHDPITTPNRYKITTSLKRGVTVINTTSCDKDFADPFPGATSDAGVNAINLECNITIASTDAAGPVPPSQHIFTVQVEDLNSPAPLSVGTYANVITWTLNVNEAQTAPTISALSVLAGGVPITPALTERTTITFQVTLTDPEKDNYRVTVEKCTDITCTTRSGFGANTSSGVYGAPATSVNNSITYDIPENAIGNNLTGNIYFYVKVNDDPDVVAGGEAFQIVTVPLNNWNAIPAINPAALTAPAVNSLVTPYNVMSGNRFTISSLGAVTDASASGSGEETIQYSWWISPQAAPAWTQIDGATTDTLRWTPGAELTANQVIRFCVSDGSVTSPSVNSDPSVPGVVCSPDYHITPKPNLSKLTAAAGLNGEVAIHHVPAERLAYVAYASDSFVHVEKFTYNADGTLNTSGMLVSSFQGVSTGSGTIRNLSLTASSTSLYVAYLADDFGPSDFRARIRKINIFQDATQSKSAAAFVASLRKFDFQYEPVYVSVTCPTSPANCVYNAVARTFTFNGDPLAPGVDFITIGKSAGVQEVIPVSSVIPTPTGSICGNCTANAQTTTFAQAINSHSSTILQGLSVSPAAVGGVSTLYGLENNASYNSSSIITSIGKIVFNTLNNRWYLPVINPALGGANVNKIQVLSDVDGSVSTVETADILTSLDTVSSIDNGLTPSGDLLIGLINQSGISKLANVPLIGNLYGPSVPTVRTIFSGIPMSRIKVKPSPGVFNPYVYVVAKDATNEFRLARVPSALGSAGDQVTALAIADNTNVANALILDPTMVIDMDLQPAILQGTEISTSDARLAVVSSASGTAQTYLFRWKKIAGSPFEALSCSEGLDIDLEGEEMQATTKIVTAPISAVTIGSAGGVVGENTKNIMPILRINNTGPAEFGLMNSQVESIDSTTKLITGEYRPALFK